MIRTIIFACSLLTVMITSQLYAMGSEAKSKHIETLAEFADFIKQAPKEETAKEKIKNLTDDLARRVSPHVVAEYFHISKKNRPNKTDDQIKKTQEMFWKQIQKLKPSFWKNTIQQLIYEVHVSNSEKDDDCSHEQYTVSSYEMLDATSLVMNEMQEEINRLAEQQINVQKSRNSKSPLRKLIKSPKRKK